MREYSAKNGARRMSVDGKRMERVGRSSGNEILLLVPDDCSPSFLGGGGVDL